MIQKRLRHLILSGYGVRVTVKNGLLVVRKEGESLVVSPRELEQVVVTGEVSLTSRAVYVMLENGVDVVFAPDNSSLFARVMRQDVNVVSVLWRKQLMLDEGQRLVISQEIVSCLIYNKVRLLQSLARNRASVIPEIDDISALQKQVDACTSKDSLLGIEGYASRLYFSAIKRVIPAEVFGFDGRIKHPPCDGVNSLLSYGYTVLLSQVSFALLSAGLNVFEGILHESYRDRMALAFDLIEEFRQPLVDRVVLTLVIRGTVRPSDFIVDSGRCIIADAAKKRFLDALFARFEEQYLYEGKEIEFQDIILMQAKRLASAIGSNRRYEGFRYR